MPDTLVDLSSGADQLASPLRGLAPLPFNATDLLVGLYRKAQAAEEALEADEEAEDGPLHKSYHAAIDRFMDAPVNTMGDVLLKLETLAVYEDLEASPRLMVNRILLALLRDLRATDGALHKLSTIENPRGPNPDGGPST